MSTKVSVKTKLGYGIGQMGDSIGFNVFYFFFLFFLTDIIGLNPAIAGAISLIAVIWDAITDPIIGYLSDNLKSKHGRRRPFMIVAAIPYAIVMYLMFTDVNLSESAKNIYFIIISMLFWTSYTAFVIPYFALGAEITQDFEERTSLRVWASYFMYAAVLLASAAPPMIVSMTEEAGGSVAAGWRNVGLIFSVLTFIAIFVCWYFTKGTEPVGEAIVVEKKEEKENLLQTYKEIFSLKAVKPLALSILCWSCTCAMGSSAIIYLMNHNLQYAAGRQSFTLVFLSVMAVIWLPIINHLVNKYDKGRVYAYGMLISAIAIAAFYFIGFGNYALLLICIVLLCFGNTVYWTVYYSMMYDISELDDFVNGKRREGAITAIMSFGQKLGSAFSMWVVGQALAIGGYGVVGMEASATNMINMLYTVIPAVFGIVAGIAVVKYPITRERFYALSEALKLRSEGKEYSTDGFKELLK